jgi:hypothetical protein
MKSFFTVFLLFTILALVACFNEDQRTCTDKLNDDPNFKEKCVDLYCACLHDCSKGKNRPKDGYVDPMNSDYTVEECFRNNKCSIKTQLPQMIDCATCLMERPDETYKCNEWQEERERQAAAKKKKKKKKKKVTQGTEETSSTPKETASDEL